MSKRKLTPPKKKTGRKPNEGVLTRAKQLTRADDLMSDILDSFLWPDDPSKATMKFTSSYRRPRGLNLDMFKEIAGKAQLVGRKKLGPLAKEFRKLPAVSQYIGHEAPPNFNRHVQFYLELFHPNSGITLRETNRFSDRELAIASNPSLAPPLSTSGRASHSPSPAVGSSKAEVPPQHRTHLAVFATQPFLKDQVITTCQGSYATITAEEDEEVRRNSADFSHIVDSQNKNLVYCGPGRFVNHDCNNNAEFARGGKTVHLKAVKPIAIGEEILTSYGRSYFGTNNSECKCATCERRHAGYYSRDGVLPEALPIPVEKGWTRSGRTSRSNADGSEPSRSNSPAVSSVASTLPSPNGSPRRGPADRSPAAIARRVSKGGLLGRRRPLQVDTPATLNPVTYTPVADLRQPIFPPESLQAASSHRGGSDESDAADSDEEDDESEGEEDEDEEGEEGTEDEPPAKRQKSIPGEPKRTYWLTTKQRLMNIMPWDESQAAPKPPPKPKGPSKSYWVSSKDKAAGRAPWDESAASAKKDSPPRITRTTSAARKAVQGGKVFRGMPTAPKGGRLNYKVLETEEVKMLTSAVGRELLGLRLPRGAKRGALLASMKVASTSTSVEVETVDTSTPEEATSLQDVDELEEDAEDEAESVGRSLTQVSQARSGISAAAGRRAGSSALSVARRFGSALNSEPMEDDSQPFDGEDDSLLTSTEIEQVLIAPGLVDVKLETEINMTVSAVQASAIGEVAV